MNTKTEICYRIFGGIPVLILIFYLTGWTSCQIITCEPDNDYILRGAGIIFIAGFSLSLVYISFGMIIAMIYLTQKFH
jgi:hypothetical protein